MTFLMVTSLCSGLFMLASFGAAMILWDRCKKLEKLRADDREDFTAYAAKLREGISARDDMLAHWCNQSIQLQRQIQDVYADKRRWERAYAVKLPRSYN